MRMPPELHVTAALLYAHWPVAAVQMTVFNPLFNHAGQVFVGAVVFLSPGTCFILLFFSLSLCSASVWALAPQKGACKETHSMKNP